MAAVSWPWKLGMFFGRVHLKGDIGKGSVLVRLVPNFPVSWLDVGQVLIAVMRVQFFVQQ